MYIDNVPNRNSPPAILLRESYRDGKKVCKRTVVNITKWPKHVINGLKELLSGKTLVPQDGIVVIERTTPHGHVKAILGAIKQLELDTIIYSKPCRERNLVLAMIVERLIYPCSKLATTRVWHSTTLAEQLCVEDATEEELYAAMDWLFVRQKKIENKLAKRHITEDSVVLYDTSSSYYEGRTCPLIAFGHNKDRKKGKQIIVYGVMTDSAGRPVAVDVYPGNTGDSTTALDQVNKLRKRFKLSNIVLVGDRGMITQTKVDTLKEYPGIGWISALKSKSIKELINKKHLQLSLFDKKNLAEISSPDYPGERLIACFNPLLAEERARKRSDLLEATEKKLKKIATQAERRTKKPLAKEQIGIKVGKIINQYKMGKHFNLTIKDSFIAWERKENLIEQEAKQDGIYVIRTSEPKKKMSAENTVRNYKSLSLVERVFRSLKGIDILVRPIHHRTVQRVKTHIFICMLAYYVEWHMRKKLAPLLFDDEQLDEDRKVRDPVAPAKPSDSAKKKKKVRKTKDGFPIHSFDTLLIELGTLSRNRCKLKSSPESPSFYQDTEIKPIQMKAFQLLDL
ncbi:MAG: IS1634 family transposase [Candidatus Zixiibacteriota bacterium]